MQEFMLVIGNNYKTFCDKKKSESHTGEIGSSFR